MQRVITRFAGTHKSSRPKFKFNYWVYRDLHSRSNSLRPLKTEPEIISKRVSKWQNVKPLSDFLTDSFKRKHDYLRISVTERCNLRCLYCMPEEGVELSPDEKLLSTDEIVQLSKVFVSQGVTKIRLTGGEPTVRKDIIDIFARLKQIKGLKEICMTSNGVSLMRKLPKLVQNGLTGLNLSLDTLVDGKYTLITRRNGLKNVLKSLDVALELGVPKVKINCVVMNNFNEDEILDFVELTKNKPVEVRFIEYMPFDGNRWSDNKMISYKEMFQTIESKYGEKLVSVHDSTNGETAKTWKIDGYQGKVGFITSMTQNFCGTCTRLRITCDGNLKVCLFGNHEVNLKDILRSPNYSEDYLLEVIGRRAYSTLTHVDEKGEASMVDVSDKAITQRVARASGKIKFSSDIAMEQIAANTNKKGDVLSTARIAGILGVKRTCDLIPLCHNIFISKVSISFQAADNSIEATCQVKCQGKTGVEMEALTGVSISLLTIYDMCKAVDKGMAIADIKVVEKIGGKSGSWKLED